MQLDLEVIFRYLLSFKMYLVHNCLKYLKYLVYNCLKYIGATYVFCG